MLIIFAFWFVRRTNRTRLTPLPFTTEPLNDAIDVFDTRILLEPRRAVTFFQCLYDQLLEICPGMRGQATSINMPSEVTEFPKTPKPPQSFSGKPSLWQPLGITNNDHVLSNRLPTFSSPSSASGRLDLSQR